MNLPTERTMKKAANRAYDLAGFMNYCDYSPRSHSPGSNSMRRIKRTIGKETYREIASGVRYGLPKARWSRVVVNKRRG